MHLTRKDEDIGRLSSVNVRFRNSMGKNEVADNMYDTEL